MDFGGKREGGERLVDVRVVKADEVKGRGFKGGVGGGLARERDLGKAVEFDGRGDRGDVLVDGPDIERRGSEEDGDGEGWDGFDYEFPQLHHGYQVPDCYKGVENYGIHERERERKSTAYYGLW